MVKRLMISGDFRRWPQNIVPYEFSSSILGNSESRSLIEQAMHEWQAVSCIRFEPFSTSLAQQLGHDQRMLFQTSESGCFASLGFLDPRIIRGSPRNRVNLGNNCMYKRVILHEIGHGLGLYHQQARPDRDENLDVIEANVNPNMWSQYDIPTPAEHVDL